MINKQHLIYVLHNVLCWNDFDINKNSISDLAWACEKYDNSYYCEEYEESIRYYGLRKLKKFVYN